MSWAEIKKINDNLDIPLNKLIDFTPSTTAARNALTALGYTQRSTITTSPMGTIYLFWKNSSVKSCSWDEAYEICTNWWKEINRWSQSQGYGNICIASRMPTHTDTGSWLPSSGNTWTGTQNSSSNDHYRWYGSSYNYNNNDNNSYQVVPVALII